MKKLPFLSGIMLLLLSGCVATDDYDFDSMEGISLSPTYAFPLVKGDLGINNLLGEADSLNLSVREDDVLYFHYEEEFQSNDLMDFIEIPDLEYPLELRVPTDLPIPAGGDFILDSQETFLFIEADQHFKNILYKAGELQVEINSSIGVPVEVTYTFPAITKDGKPLTQSFTTNSSFSSVTETTALQGYLNDLTTGDEGYNFIPFSIEIRVVNTTDATVFIPQGSGLTVGLGLLGQEFELISGYFGEFGMDFSTMSMEVGPFDETLQEVNLADIMIDMEVTNSYGIPMSLSFTEFVAVNADGDEVEVKTNPATDIDIAYPEVPGEEAKTNIQIVNGSEVFNSSPEEIRYTARAHVNEGGVEINNFVSDDSSFKFKLAADVPLIGSFREIAIQDTVEVDFKSDFEEFEVKSLSLKTKLANDFPFDGSFQVYMLDDQQRVTDSLLLDSQKDVIISSNLTEEGDLASPGVYEHDIQISSEKLDLLSDASFLIIKAVLHTSPGENNEFPPVKFKSSYRLNIDLGILAELETTIEL